jgi:hypothetical protein
VSLKRARQDHGDVALAARQLGIKTVEHGAAVQRADEFVRRLDARMRSAQASGYLTVFNRAYRAYRLGRMARGEPAMSYAAAQSRLKRSLTSVAAGKAPGPGVAARHI